MKTNFQKALKLLGPHEGGWSDHPKDPGGATMKGVTLQNYRRYVKPKATKTDLKNISDEEVEFIYRKHYWDKINADNLPSGIDYALFDFTVNSGNWGAKKIQSIVGVPVDGIVGPRTTRAIRDYRDQKELINKLQDARQAFVERIRTYPTFGRGWTRRIAEVRKSALAMAADADPTPVTDSPKAPQRVTVLSVIIDLIKAIFGGR